MTRIRYELRGSTAEITLDNPPVNALSEDMVGELIAALDRAAGDSDARAVILASGVSRRFCAGLDLGIVERASGDEIRALLEKLYPGVCDAQLRLGKPSIAAVSGAARGGGMTLALSCDLIIAGHDASFGYPEIDVGVLPAIHFVHLHRIVGRYRAFELLFTGRSFSAQEALNLGLVNQVVDNDEVLQASRALAEVLATKPPETLREGRSAFYRASDHGYQAGVRDAVDTFCAVALSKEGREGVSAFVDKRSPRWRK